MFVPKRIKGYVCYLLVLVFAFKELVKCLPGHIDIIDIILCSNTLFNLQQAELSEILRISARILYDL